MKAKAASIVALAALLGACTSPSLGGSGPASSLPESRSPTPAMSDNPTPPLRTVKTRSEDPYAILGVTPAETRRSVGYVLAPSPQFAHVAISRRAARRILLRDYPSGVTPKIGKGFLVQVEILTRSPERPPLGTFALEWGFVFHAVIPQTFGAPVATPARWTVLFINAVTGNDDGGFIG